MNEFRAIMWCEDNYATVRFDRKQGRRHVEVEVAVFGVLGTGATFAEAVRKAAYSMREIERVD